LLQARAIENQSYVIGVNRVGSDANDIVYSGDSAVYDALGEVLYMKSQDEDLGIVSLQKSSLDQTRVALPFLDDADVFKIY
jgi:predicted amidohydrolase